MDWSSFTATVGTRTVASPCVEIVAISYDSAGANGKGLHHCLRAFEKRFGKQLKFYRTGDMKAFRPVDARTLKGPYSWFASEKILATKLLLFFAHSGDSDTNFITPAVQLILWPSHVPPLYVFRMALPVAVANDPDDVLAFARDALAEFPLESGFCGYSLFYHPATDEEEVTRRAAPLLLRHPGLEYGNPIPYTNATDKGVVVVNWLTLLGAKLTANLGAAKSLANTAPRGVSVLALGPGGVALRAGEAPQVGDVNRHELLPLYHAVGRLVSPRRAPDEALNMIYIEGMPEEARNDWLRRFFA